ncbi:DUF4249 domain-containing protein [Flavobacterium sp.]|uniref:DUF4249 domain-containing protein n=1 Tax=Flavobacterium sp. TaxID=239 RepID=UPI0026301506|nr:DUF4249 domain-containing protein [Flavobacterium sp.]
MKKYSLLFVLLLTFISCEDVVEVDLETAEPKLVIDANLRWEKGTAGNEQTINLSLTTGYFANEIPKVSGATVYVTNSSNTVFPFIETVPNSGAYVCTTFIPVINESYTLTVEYQGTTYRAVAPLMATPTIDAIQQNTVQGFGGDEIQVKFFYQDNGNEDNFYLVGVKNAKLALPEYGVISDEFFQGNQMFGFYTNENLETNVQLRCKLEGITERYYNYMNKLLNIAGNQGGSPFATPPATLRGNIVNQTNEADYPLGYFHLSEVDYIDYTVE